MYEKNVKAHEPEMTYRVIQYKYFKCPLFSCKEPQLSHIFLFLNWQPYFRNHSTLLICYQCWKQFCCLLFFWNLWYFFRIH